MIESAYSDGPSRRVIDLAMGILIGWRGCAPQDAFGELVAVMRDSGVPLGQLAAAVVALATGAGDPGDPVGEVAAQQWGELHAAHTLGGRRRVGVG